MGLNVKKLENVEYHGSRTIARCPACAEQGHDNKGEHLSIDEQGRFSCVVYPGNTGTGHRKRIFALVGVNDGNGKSYSKAQNKMIKVKKVNRNHGTVIKANVLGRLGRVNQTLKKQNENDIKEHIYNKNNEKRVPSVPKTEDDIRTSKYKAADIENKAIAPTVEKSCTCGRRATTFDFGEIENGRVDWTFYCNSCNPHAIDCSECGSRAIPYVNSSGEHILNKCNVHGARLKVTHADIDAWSREKERKRNDQSKTKRPF